MKNKPNLIRLAILFLSIWFTACNSPSDKKQKENKAVADTIRKEISLSPASLNLLYNFPTPFEIATMLEKAKAGYFFDITNSPDNVIKYNTEMSRALNLGIYSSDLSYSITYNRTEETGKFLVCTNKLADELDISGVYDKTLVDNVKKYGNNKEELIALVNGLFRQTNDFLSKNNRNEIAVLIVCGGFAEGIFLAASAAEVAVRDNSKIISTIAAQKENYEKIMTLLSAYQSDPEMKSLAESMALLNSIWTSTGIKTGKKLPLEETEKIVDLAMYVRDKMVK